LRDERATTRKRLGIEFYHGTDTAERARLTVLQCELFRTENEKLARRWFRRMILLRDTSPGLSPIRRTCRRCAQI
jgi:hypothetical protein